MTEKQKRGFGSMDRAKVREIARSGGKAAHAQGKAHRWTSDAAREAGRKGGLATRRGETKSDVPTTERE